MHPFRFRLAVLMGFLLHSTVGVHSTQQCLKEYIKLMSNSGVDVAYVNELRSLEKKTPKKASGKGKVVLDLSIASVDAFYHMMQLNVSGINRHSHISSHCRLDGGIGTKPPSDLRYLSSNQVQAFNHNLNWFSFLASYPDSVVVMSDTSDTDYFNYQFDEICSENRPPEYCFVPVVPTLSENKPQIDEKFLISKYSLVQVGSILNAYRSLVHCMVPSDQLFVFNLRNISSTDYWTGLTRLLHLDYSSVPSGKSTVSYLDHLIAGGLGAVPRHRQVCIPQVGTNKDICSGPKLVEVSPSVCDSVSDLLPASTADKLSKCATRYADTMVEILGGDQRYKSLLLDQMMFSSGNTLRRASLDSSRLILDVAPGTTGTTSLFLTMQLLNITGRHFTQRIQNCSFHDPLDDLIDSDMKILSLPEHNTAVGNNGRVFWADTPLSDQWWHLFRMYPKSRIILTDIRDTAAWIVKRRRDHCSTMKIKAGCTVPVPVDAHQLYNTSEIVKSFYHQVFVATVKPEVGVKVYDAFRDLIRCAVPPEQLMWIYFTEQNNSASFWNSMISFTGIKVENNLKNILIEKGVPMSTPHTACSFGRKPCVFVGRRSNSALIPSVCAWTNSV